MTADIKNIKVSGNNSPQNQHDDTTLENSWKKPPKLRISDESILDGTRIDSTKEMHSKEDISSPSKKDIEEKDNVEFTASQRELREKLALFKAKKSTTPQNSSKIKIGHLQDSNSNEKRKVVLQRPATNSNSSSSRPRRRLTPVANPGELTGDVDGVLSTQPLKGYICDSSGMKNNEKHSFVVNGGVSISSSSNSDLQPEETYSSRLFDDVEKSKRVIANFRKEIIQVQDGYRKREQQKRTLSWLRWFSTILLIALITSFAVYYSNLTWATRQNIVELENKSTTKVALLLEEATKNASTIIELAEWKAQKALQETLLVQQKEQKSLDEEYRRKLNDVERERAKLQEMVDTKTLFLENWDNQLQLRQDSIVAMENSIENKKLALQEKELDFKAKTKQLEFEEKNILAMQIQAEKQAYEDAMRKFKLEQHHYIESAKAEASRIIKEAETKAMELTQSQGFLTMGLVKILFMELALGLLTFGLWKFYSRRKTPRTLYSLINSEKPVVHSSPTSGKWKQWLTSEEDEGEENEIVVPKVKKPEKTSSDTLGSAMIPQALFSPSSSTPIMTPVRRSRRITSYRSKMGEK